MLTGRRLGVYHVQERIGAGGPAFVRHETGGELWRGLAGGDPRQRIAQPALLVGSLCDPTLGGGGQVRFGGSRSAVRLSQCSSGNKSFQLF